MERGFEYTVSVDKCGGFVCNKKCVTCMEFEVHKPSDPKTRRMIFQMFSSTIAPHRVCLVQFLPEEAMLCTVWLRGAGLQRTSLGGRMERFVTHLSNITWHVQISPGAYLKR